MSPTRAVKPYMRRRHPVAPQAVREARFSLEPLLRQLALATEAELRTKPEDLYGFSLRDAARVLGLSTRSLVRLRAVGLSHRQADRLATKAGFLPYALWPDWVIEEWDELAVDLSDLDLAHTTRDHDAA